MSLVLGSAGGLPSATASTALMERRGELWVSSAATGKRLARFRGAAAGDEFGAAWDFQAIVGTVSGGIVVGTPGAGNGAGGFVVFDLFDGRNGRKMQTATAADLGGGLQRLGEQVQQIGHINNENTVHWVLGAPGHADDPDSPAAVVVLRGQATELIERERILGAPGSMLGWSVIGVDGGPFDSIIRDFAVGAPRGGRKPDAGSVQSHDSTTGAQRWVRNGPRAREHFGYRMRPLQDRNGDGDSDLLVGAPGRQNRRPAGRVYVVSGATGVILDRIDAPADAVLFGFDSFMSDLDLDGAAELVVSAPATPVAGEPEVGSVFVFDDAGRLIERFDGDTPGGWFGVSISAFDLDGDGDRELLVSDLGRHPKARRDFRGRGSVVGFPDGEVLRRLVGKPGRFLGARSFGIFGFDRDGDEIVDLSASLTSAPIPFIPE